MERPNNREPIDRPIKDILLSMTSLIHNKTVKGQFARDLEKLCIYASMQAARDDINAGKIKDPEL